MKEEIVLYSIGCPQCKVLEMKLEKKGIGFTLNESREDMDALGIKSAPVLSVNGTLMKFTDAVKWVAKQ